MGRAKNVLFSLILIALATTITFAAGEVILRIKNSSMTNYDIEMWRYSNELKEKSPDPAIDFTHVRSKTAVLQSVPIRINEWGLRGGPVTPSAPGERRILFLGGSITLGWGVKEEDTVEARLQRLLTERGEAVQVLNGGVGNYNAERYVSRFFKYLTGLQPTDIVVHYFLRDAEQLPAGGGNFMLRHSELALVLWSLYHRFVDQAGERTLVEHYREVYRPDAPGFQVMRGELKQLADYAAEKKIRIYLAMMPDIHNLVDYKFGFIHEMMRNIANEDGYTYVDLLPVLTGRPPQELFAMPGDPHPNALGHKLMADALLPALSRHVAGGER